MDIDAQPTSSTAPAAPFALDPMLASVPSLASMSPLISPPPTSSTASTPALVPPSSFALTPTSSNPPLKTASNRSASSQGKRKYSALDDKEALTKSTKPHSEANASGSTALLHGFCGSVDSIKDHLQMMNSISPVGVVKDAMEKLDGAWGSMDHFSSAERSVLRKIFSDDMKKAATYANTSDMEDCHLWALLELQMDPYASMLRTAQEILQSHS